MSSKQSEPADDANTSQTALNGNNTDSLDSFDEKLLPLHVNVVAAVDRAIASSDTLKVIPRKLLLT